MALGKQKKLEQLLLEKFNSNDGNAINAFIEDVSNVNNPIALDPFFQEQAAKSKKLLTNKDIITKQQELGRQTIFGGGMYQQNLERKKLLGI